MEKILVTQIKISNSFNDFFGTIAAKTKSKIIHTNKSFTDYLTNPNNQSLFWVPTTTSEINSIIMSLNDNKTNGPASIPNSILKLIAPSISPILSNIINLCFSIRHFP